MSDTRFSKPLIYMLIGSAIILALSLGVRHAFGLYLVPMSDEFGWGHNVFSLAIAMQNLIWGAVPTRYGLLPEYGSEVVVAVGGALYSLRRCSLAVSFNWLVAPNLSLGFTARSVTFCRPLFPCLLVCCGTCRTSLKQRSWRWVLPVPAGSFGQFIMLPSTLLLLQSIGWSAALMVSAILIALIIPLAWTLKAPGLCTSEHIGCP